MIRQTTVAINTATGLQTITVAGMTLTPLAVTVVLTKGTTDNTQTAGAAFCFGATDGTNEFTVSTISDDGSENTNTQRRLISNLAILNDTVAIQSRVLSFDAFVAGGIRINVATTDGNPVTGTFTFFTSDDVESAKVDIIALTSTPQTVTTSNPTSVVISASVASGNSNAATHAILSYGISTNELTDKNSAVFYWDRDAIAATQFGMYRSDTECMGQVFNGTKTWGGAIGNYTATGFDVTTTGTVGSDQFGYLAIELKAGVEFSLFSDDGPITTGSKSYDQGYTTEFAMIVMSDVETLATIESTGDDGLSLYLASDDGDVSHALSVQDAATNTVNKSLYAESKIKDLQGGTSVLTEGTLTTLDDLTFNFTTAPGTAKKWFGLSIGSSAGGPVVNANADITVSAPLFAGNASALAPVNNASSAITIPHPTFATTAQSLAPIINSSTAFDVTSPIFASSAQSLAPIISSSVDFSITSPIFASTAQAIPAGSGANASIIISKPVFAGTAQSILPVITANAAFSILSPLFSSSAQSLAPTTAASASIIISAPQFSSSAQAIGVDVTSDIQFSISAPIFSVFAGGAILAYYYGKGTQIKTDSRSRVILAPRRSKEIKIVNKSNTIEV